ncbi:MAG: PadR family transcriptional regulator [Candidatus Binatia bacterium]
MLWHVILGLLRDDTPRHGYELAREYRVRSGVDVASGNFYRELARLVERGFIKATENPPDVDERRIPYLITVRGRQVFDRWLTSPAKQDADLTAWLLFVDRLPGDVREKLLERRIDDLWIRGKALSRDLDEATEMAEMDEDSAYYNLRPALISRRIKLNTVELEFVKQFREDFNVWRAQREIRRMQRERQAGAAEIEATVPIGESGAMESAHGYEHAARAGAPPVVPDVSSGAGEIAHERPGRGRTLRSRGTRK